MLEIIFVTQAYSTNAIPGRAGTIRTSTNPGYLKRSAELEAHGDEMRWGVIRFEERNDEFDCMMREKQQDL
jgi:hypothetical protein